MKFLRVLTVGMVALGMALASGPIAHAKKKHAKPFSGKEIKYATKCIGHATDCKKAIDKYAGSCKMSKDEAVDTLVKHGAAALLTAGLSIVVSLSYEQGNALKCVLNKAGPHI